MKQILMTILLLFISNLIHSQNLVPNPSFEDTIYCPVYSQEINSTLFWYSPTILTTDLFHSCNVGDVGVPDNLIGWQNARTGNAYAGFTAFYGYPPDNLRQYIQVELIDTLTNSKKYNIKFYLSLADDYEYAVNNIGIYFSLDSFFINTNENIDFIPQIENDSTNPLTDKENWKLVEGTYTATGGEKYITIGNFRDNVNSDTIYIGGLLSNNSYYYIDDVSVILDTLTNISESIEKEDDILFVKVYPNPAKDEIIVELNNLIKSSFELYNLLGKKIINTQLTRNKTNISVSNIDDGIYYYKITHNNQTINNGKLVIIK